MNLPWSVTLRLTQPHSALAFQPAHIFVLAALHSALVQQGGSRNLLGLAQCFGGSMNDGSLEYTTETWAQDGKVPEGYPVLPDYAQSLVLWCMAELKTTLEQAAQWVPQGEASPRTTRTGKNHLIVFRCQRAGSYPISGHSSSAPSVDIWCMWELCAEDLKSWCSLVKVWDTNNSRRKSHLYDQKWS